MMKRFKLLGALFVGLIGLVGFGYCGTLTYNIPVINFPTSSKYYNTSKFLVSKELTVSSNIQSSFTVCAYGLPSGYSYNAMYYTAPTSLSERVAISNNSCVEVYNGWVRTDEQIYVGIGFSATATLNGTFGDGNGYFTVSSSIIPDSGGCPTCDEQYTSEECQQEYSLMPISSCNSEYCGLNGLCPESTGNVMSELYINGINHLGAPIININIPLEQAWDYEYTGDYMNIVISGENNVDYEYMDNIIRTQNSKPNDTDFNNIVSGLLPKFVPGLVIILFILFVFRFLKKIF